MRPELRLKKIKRTSRAYRDFSYHYQFADKSWWISTYARLSDEDVACLVAHMRYSLEKLGMSRWGELSKGQIYSIAGDAFNDLLEARARREIQAMVKLKPLSEQGGGESWRLK